MLLDFWTFCCINCLHVLDELRPLEDAYSDELTIIGVHSPKFEHEKNAGALRCAVERYEVTHPVLDDPDLLTWKAYTARAWPTLTLIDPEGYVIFSMSGEGHEPGLHKLLEQLVPVYQKRGTLHPGPSQHQTTPKPTTPLRFPGKAIPAAHGGFFVSSSTQQQIVELEAGAQTVLRRFGSAKRGATDGPHDIASFSEPQGLLLLPDVIAKTVGYDMIVADTVNHLLRGIRLNDGYTTTIAGTGKQWQRPSAETQARKCDLSSPWDLAWFDEKVIIAMAGIHQLWWFDPLTETIGVYAGTTTEALGDGPLDQAWLAQPSGLSVFDDTLWIADSENSALRFVRNGSITTVVGHGLFDFGSIDGKASDALFQHPLGVFAVDENVVLVADTYNGSIRRFDKKTNVVSTVATNLNEPSDLVADTDGNILIVESGAHKLTPLVSAEAHAIQPDTKRFHTERPPILIAPGPLTLEVAFEAPPGQKLDEQFGPSTRLTVSSSPQTLLTSGTGESTNLERSLSVDLSATSGVLQITATAATCDEEGEHPACHLIRQDWGVPIVIAADGESHVRLVLHGTYK